jgi:hypothetical protein
MNRETARKHSSASGCVSGVVIQHHFQHLGLIQKSARPPSVVWRASPCRLRPVECLVWASIIASASAGGEGLGEAATRVPQDWAIKQIRVMVIAGDVHLRFFDRIAGMARVSGGG